MQKWAETMLSLLLFSTNLWYSLHWCSRCRAPPGSRREGRGCSWTGGCPATHNSQVEFTQFRHLGWSTVTYVVKSWFITNSTGGIPKKHKIPVFSKQNMAEKAVGINPKQHRAGHATTLPRQRDHVFRPTNSCLLHYVSIRCGHST